MRCVRKRRSGNDVNRSAMVAALLALAVAACGGDPMGGTGAFSLTVSGDATRAIEGSSASFGTETLPFSGLRVWVIDLHVVAGGALDGVSIVTSDPDRLGEGTYTLADVTLIEDLGPGEVGGFVALAIDGGSPGFSGASASGTLTLTTSRDDRVTGTFQLEAEGTVFFEASPPQSGSVTVTGEFDAARRAGT